MFALRQYISQSWIMHGTSPEDLAFIALNSPFPGRMKGRTLGMDTNAVQIYLSGTYRVTTSMNW
jgi:hypothetical protein